MEARWGNIGSDDENPYLTSDEENLWYSEEEYIDDPQPMTAEVKAFERAGPGSTLIGPSFGDLNEIAKKMRIISEDYSEQFALYVDAISRKLNSNEEINISEDDITAMLNNIRKLKNVEHINPSAYILGYIASNGGKNMNIEKVKWVINVVSPKLDIGSVKPPDIVRYARFWMSLI
jgi:hypothetical protein